MEENKNFTIWQKLSQAFGPNSLLGQDLPTYKLDKKELPNIIAELNSIKSKLKDKVTQIKLSETISVLEKMKIGKSVTDGQVSSIMLSYELIKELKSKVK